MATTPNENHSGVGIDSPGQRPSHAGSQPQGPLAGGSPERRRRLSFRAGHPQAHRGLEPHLLLLCLRSGAQALGGQPTGRVACATRSSLRRPTWTTSSTGSRPRPKVGESRWKTCPTRPSMRRVLATGAHPHHSSTSRSWSRIIGPTHAGELNQILATVRGEAWEFTEEVEENHGSTAGYRVRAGWMSDEQARRYEDYAPKRDMSFIRCPVRDAAAGWDRAPIALSAAPRQGILPGS